MNNQFMKGGLVGIIKVFRIGSDGIIYTIFRKARKEVVGGKVWGEGNMFQHGCRILKNLKNLKKNMSGRR